MRLISMSPLAVAISRAGGIGFLAAGEDLTNLDNNLQEAKSLLEQHPIPGASCDVLPIGIGFINWGADLNIALKAIEKHLPAAVWLFAPNSPPDLVPWTSKVRESTGGRTRIWIQVGSVIEAVTVARLCAPEVLVVQGADAGGHGLERNASIVSLLPEIADALDRAGCDGIRLVAAGGIVDGRGVAAGFALGASAAALGTRFLACSETPIAKGYKDEVVQAQDGGVTTVRSRVYDQLRGTTGWPPRYNARGIINQSFHDAQGGLVTRENKALYAEALKNGDLGWGVRGRLTTYAGTAVGLVDKVMSAEEILKEIRNDCNQVLRIAFCQKSSL
ncbi:hypothetical protein MMC20_007962 [Loxospora ochrophaea]|nr:hypothetical protein [Loxospora ochrophaea]